MTVRRRRAATALAVAPIAWAGGWMADSAIDLVNESARTTDLPETLREVSGLAFQGADTLWAHDDERGAVVALDPETGDPLARRVLGPRAVLADFEGLAWDGRHLHLVTSTGTLVSFEPGVSETVDRYGVRETTARALCEVEGVAFDPTRRTLVMACKTILVAGRSTGVLLLEAELPPGPTGSVGEPLPVRVALDVGGEALRNAGLPRRLALSDIAYDRARDSWLLIAARQRRVVEIARDGSVLAHARLDGRRHPQAEGLALAPDRRTLYVADEGGGGRARLHLYRVDARP